MKALPLTFAMAALLAGCDSGPEEAGPQYRASEDSAQATLPDPSACPPPKYAYDEEEFGKRQAPLAIPADFAGFAATDGSNLAVTSLGGGQICHAVNWMLEFNDAGLVAPERFFGIGYSGYEAFGFLLFDRSGEGLVVDTGERPHLSPSADQLAALQLSESSYGGLESFVIWQVQPTGLSEIYRLPESLYPSLPWQDFTDFRIVRWEGETCLAISAVAIKDVEAAGWDWQLAPRSPFHARKSDGWTISPGSCR